MATTFLQKLRLGIGGWMRRREEKQQAFVNANASWSARAPAAAAAPRATPMTNAASIDWEGLQCAYLDDSGVIAYYLDTESGEVVDVRDGAVLAPPRFRRVPARSAQSDEADRRAFVDAMEPTEQRAELARRVDAPEAFRKSLANDRALERAWYNFKNDRATAAIKRWIETGK